ncbi:MAG: AAA family ATPase [Rhodobacteraceae bacterium]|nr:AAA family ATPase [Paracoccaceae bacterium]TVR46724.1 MAG: pilus assembly protein CpaE [Paracoccaceae bacterium]
MASDAANTPPRIRACTVSRNVQNFDLLIEDMETIYKEDWGDLTFAEAVAFLDTENAAELELLAIALDDEDEGQFALVRSVIEKASANGVRSLLIAESLSPILLHQLLRAGADDFVPYPLPENALQDAITRLHDQRRQNAAASQPGTTGTGRNGNVFCVHALSGGAGGTNFAVNLAWDLSVMADAQDQKVCIIDLDFQSGSVATYLDLARTEKVYELLSQTASMDRDAFSSALQTFNEKLSVLTAPSDMLPLDLLTPDDIERVITMARDNFDFVIVDMPRTIVHWTETALDMSDLFFAMIELDLRSAQNTLRMIRALKADSISMDKHRFILNRAPRFTDLGGKARAKRMAESLGISIAAYLPDGGAQVRDANDHGLPLAEYAPKNPAHKDIQKFAAALFETAQATHLAAE